MKLLKYPIIIILGLVANCLLFLAIPILQVLFGNPPPKRQEKDRIIAPIETVIEKPPQKTQKKQFKAIKSFVRRAKPTSPVSRNVKMDLSVVSGGEGVAVEAGQIGVVTYNPGETDTDAQLIDQGKKPKMPLRASREEVNGYAVALFVVNETGRVEEVQIENEEPKGYGFGKAVRKYVKTLKFRPATIKKVPVRQRMRQRVEFEN